MVCVLRAGFLVLQWCGLVLDIKFDPFMTATTILGAKPLRNTVQWSRTVQVLPPLPRALLPPLYLSACDGCRLLPHVFHKNVHGRSREASLIPNYTYVHELKRERIVTAVTFGPQNRGRKKGIPGVAETACAGSTGKTTHRHLLRPRPTVGSGWHKQTIPPARRCARDSSTTTSVLCSIRRSIHSTSYSPAKIDRKRYVQHKKR